MKVEKVIGTVPSKFFSGSYFFSENFCLPYIFLFAEICLSRCDNSNFARRSECNRCGESKPGGGGDGGGGGGGIFHF